MQNYEIWGSKKHGQYCLTRVSNHNEIFGKGKLPYTAKRLVVMELPNDDAAVFMYKRYFDALDVQDGEYFGNHVGLPVWSTFEKEK